MISKKSAQILRLVLKITITLAALFFVFRKIDFPQFLESIASINIWYYLLALLTFHVSKIISSFRLNQFYESTGLKLDWKTNLKLYYVGMFYNLFLPGAISGDAYKVYLLKQAGVEAKTKKLVSATFLDRVSGMAFLVILALIFLLGSSFVPDDNIFYLLIIGLAILVLPCYYLFIRILFKGFIGKYWITNGLSLLVQLGQVGAAMFLLMALSQETHIMDYLTMFMLSSVAVFIPFTIGGVGARETIFYFGSEHLGIAQPEAIAFASLFFSISALTALTGLLFTYFIDKEIAQKQASLPNQSQG